MRKTTNQEKEVLNYLNNLRDSGVTNMFGARPYVEQEFNIPGPEASKLVSLWMENFNEEGNYGEVKA